MVWTQTHPHLQRYLPYTAGLPRSGKNIWKMKFFPSQGNPGIFVDGQGKLERTWKVREKSGNSKIKGRQT